MNTWEIDQYLGQTPCICGDEHTWHPACYKGKTQAQIDSAYKKVYARINRRIKEETRAALNAA